MESSNCAGSRRVNIKVLDYENNRDLGTIDSENPKLTARFREHLLLEADRG